MMINHHIYNSADFLSVDVLVEQVRSDVALVIERCESTRVELLLRCNNLSTHDLDTINKSDTKNGEEFSCSLGLRSP